MIFFYPLKVKYTMILYVLVAVGVVLTCYHRGACKDRVPPLEEMDPPESGGESFDETEATEGLHRRPAHGWDLV